MAQAFKSVAVTSGEAESPSSGVSFERRGEQLWIAVCLPELALESVDGAAANRTAGRRQPSIVVDSPQGRLCVVAVNAAARSLGIRPGFNLNASFGFSGSIRVLERSPRAERIHLEALAGACHELTPTVSLEPPESLLLEVRASLKLFGGLESIKAALAEVIAARGFTFCSSAAPTPLGALWLARNRSEDALLQEALHAQANALPLQVTRWSDRTLALLQDMGVVTIGDCLRLPRGGFARRVGKACLEDLDKALGRRPDLRPGYAPPRTLSFEVELLDASTSLPVFVAAVTRMTEHLANELRVRQAQVQGLELSFRHLRQPPTLQRLELLEASADQRRFLDLLCDRMERMTLPAPATALGLCAGPLQALAGQSARLFRGEPGSCDEAAAVRLVERLRGRLGQKAVYGLAAAAEHRPERAWVKVAKLRAKAAEAPVSPWAHTRPLWLLPAPRKLPPGDAPSSAGGALQLEDGPERIESGWWDGQDASRDYFEATTERGEKLWVYRDRVERCWYLHGVFG